MECPVVEAWTGEAYEPNAAAMAAMLDAGSGAHGPNGCGQHRRGALSDQRPRRGGLCIPMTHIRKPNGQGGMMLECPSTQTANSKRSDGPTGSDARPADPAT